LNIHGTAQDITARKEAEFPLADSEAYSKALFAQSDTPLVVMNPDTAVFLDCNEAAVKAYQLDDRKYVLGKTPLDVSAPTQYDGTPTTEAVQFNIAAARKTGLHVFDWRHQEAQRRDLGWRSPFDEFSPCRTRSYAI